jgi:hypothetical protein
MYLKDEIFSSVGSLTGGSSFSSLKSSLKCEYLGVSSENESDPLIAKA